MVRAIPKPNLRGARPSPNPKPQGARVVVSVMVDELPKTPLSWGSTRVILGSQAHRGKGFEERGLRGWDGSGLGG